jgi:methionyl-tRNA formyltransferase
LFTRWKGKLLQVLEAVPVELADARGAGEPGEVLAMDGGVGVGIVTGSGVLRLERLQLEGRRPASAAEFVRGYANFQGARLPS